MVASGARIVAVGGQANNGKDEVADCLAEALGASWSRDAFAMPIKRIFCEVFGVDLAFVERWKREPNPPPGFSKTVREILVSIGETFRSYRKDVWIELALREKRDVVFSDLRHDDELAAVAGTGGYSILLWRPGHENDLPNPSERELTPHRQGFVAAGVRGVTSDPLVDYFLVNDGSIADLRRVVREDVVPRIAEKFLR